MKRSVGGIGVLAVLMLTGCTDGNAEKEKLEIEEKVLVKEDEGMKLDIAVPEIDGMDEFNQQAIKLGKDLEAEVRGSVLEESPPDNEAMQAAGEMDYEVEFVDDQTVSVLIESYLYGEGWVHGVTSLEPLNYDIGTGSVVELADLFDGDNYLAELSERARAEIEASDLKEALDLPFTEVKENQQYYLTDEEIVLVFDQYEIAAGSAGPQEIPIAKNDLKSLKDIYR